MTTRAKLASLSIALSVLFGLSSANAQALSTDVLDPDAFDPRPPIRECTLLITVREAYVGQWFATGSIIIPRLFPYPGGAYDPPSGAAGPHSLEKALDVADSYWYHSMPCTGHPGGYPSCDVVKYGPSNHPQNLYSGSGIVHCD